MFHRPVDRSRKPFSSAISTLWMAAPTRMATSGSNSARRPAWAVKLTQVSNEPVCSERADLMAFWLFFPTFCYAFLLNRDWTWGVLGPALFAQTLSWPRSWCP